MEANTRLPLAGLRVLDFGQVFAVPYVGGLLADLGAEVLKIEAPQRMDTIRSAGTYMDDNPADDPWNRTGFFQVLHRGKRSLIIDMTQDAGKELFKKLVAVSDIVQENFTPRVMPGWGLGYEELKKINPRIIMLSNCGYGSTGPWGPFPIQGTSLESTNGIVKYSGYPDAPQKAGQSYPDFISCWTGVTALLLALHALERTGEGQWIDESMYQVGVSFLPEPQLQYQIDQADIPRMGNRHPWKAPSNVYRSKGEDKWLTLSVDSDEKWQKLLSIMGRSDLANDQRFASIPARRENVEPLDAIVGEWAATQDAFEAMKTLNEAGIAAMPVFDAYDVHFNEQYLARKFLEPLDYGDEGTRVIFGRPYKMRNTDIKVRGRSPNFGEGNQHVLRDILHLPEDEIEKLYADGVIADKPVNPPAPSAGNIGRPGTLGNVDADYRKKIEEQWGSLVKSDPGH